MTVVKWTGREAQALRQARRMSLRAFAAHLGVAPASVANWEKRGERIRLRHETQQILDRDLSQAGDDVCERFDAAVTDAAAIPMPPLSIEDLGSLAHIGRWGPAGPSDISRMSRGRQSATGRLPASTRSSGPGTDTVVLRLQVDGKEVVMPLSHRLLLQTGMGTLIEAFALSQQSDALQDIAGQPSMGRRFKIASPAQLQEILANLQEQWHSLVKTDNLHGPRLALAGVLNQIGIVEALLPTLRGGPRKETVGLGAKYAESAAWLYEDSGNLPQARFWTSRAMEWAYEAGDKRMLAWTVLRRAHQATTGRAPAQAIGLARAARDDEEELAPPMRAAIRAQEAYGHALDGDEQTAQRLLDEAHSWAVGDTLGDARGGHGSYCTPSYIEIQRAGCWLTTGKAKLAIRIFEEAIPALPAVYQRDRAAALSRLAAAYAADRQVEQAASTAHAALPLARAAGSRRIVRGIKGVGVKLREHRPLPAVAAFLDDLADGD